MSAGDEGERGRDVEGLIGAAAVVMAALMIGVVSRRWLYLLPALLALAVLPFAPAGLRRGYGVIPFASLALPFAFLSQSPGPKMRALGESVFHGTFFAAVYFTYAATLALYRPRAAPQRLVYSLLLSAVAITFAGVGYPAWLHRLEVWRDATGMGERAPHPHTFLSVAAAFVGLALIWSLRRGVVVRGPARAVKGRAALLGLCLALAMGVGGGISAGIKATYAEASRLFFELTRGIPLSATGGFSDKAELGSVSSDRERDGGKTVALRAFGAERPGYLRGKVFATYEPRHWSVAKERATLSVGESKRVPFAGRTVEKGRPADWRIVTSARYNAIYFTPQRTAAVETEATRVFLYPGNILRSQDVPTVRGYSVFLDSARLRRGGEDPVYQSLPEDPELLKAIDEHIAEAKLTPDMPLQLMLRRIADHFEARYTYEFGITFDPEGPDPLVQFLRDKTHGHCELFASCGALMLRRLDVPSRYVTGFVCDERNSLDDELWIARNGSAHAWVEAYDPGEGWVLAEFTPSAGMPQPGNPSSLESFLDWVRGAWERLKAVEWSQIPIQIAFAIRAAIDWVTASWWRIAGLIGLIVGVLLARRRRPAAEVVAAERVFPPEVASVREAFLALHDRFAEHGLGRESAETLLAYAARLRQTPPAEVAEGLDPEEAAGLSEQLAALRYSAAAAPAAGNVDAPAEE